MRSTAFDAGIICSDDAAHAGNEADAGNRAAAIDIVGAIVLVHAEAAQRRYFEIRHVAVEHEAHALARQQLPARTEFLLRPVRCLAHLRFECAEFFDEREMRRAVGAVGVTFLNDHGCEAGHGGYS